MDDLRINKAVVIPAADLEVRVARSSGPGGQGVNTTDSKVELRFDLEATDCLTDRQKALVRERLGNRITKEGLLVLQSNEHRSQHRNREAVRARLRNLLGEAIQPPRQRRRTKPSRSARQRRLREKRHRGEIKRLRQRPDRE